MKARSTTPSFFVIGGLFIIALAVFWAVIISHSSKSFVSSETDVARGEYLVTHAAMCADCHTQHLANGQLDEAHRLQGAPVDFTPRHPIPNWASVAPAIAGLPGLTDKQAAALLETGVTPDGKTLRPPMPAFRFQHKDTVAIVAYLRSLKPPR